MANLSNRNPNEKRSADGAYGLAAKYVTCNEVFRREQLLVFQNEWLCVGGVHELSNNSLLVKDINGVSIAVSIDQTGTIRCFHNVCRHRGAQLVSDNCTVELNNGPNGSDIVCPYHAWRYGRSGELKTAPNMSEVDDFCKEDFGLIKVECRVWEGLIWICLSETPIDFEARFSGLGKLVDPWKIPSLSLHASIEYQVQANWKLLFQNYNECYHCPTVHPALNRLTPYKNASNDFDQGPILGGPMQLSDNSESITVDGKLADSILAGLNADQSRSVVYYTVFPSIFISLHPDYVLIHRLVPESTSQTSVTCDFLFAGSTNDANRELRHKAVQFWDETNRQDWNVCELVQKGMANHGYVPGPYSNLESLVAAFDRHYLATFDLAING